MWDCHRGPFTCRIPGCGEEFKQEANRDGHEDNVPHIAQPAKVPDDTQALGYTAFRPFSLTPKEQMDLMTGGDDDGDDGDDSGDGEGAEEETQSDWEGVEGEDEEIGRFRGQDDVAAIPSGSFQETTLTTHIDTSVGRVLLEHKVVFESGQDLPRFILEHGVIRKLMPVEVSNLKKLAAMEFIYSSKHYITSVCEDCRRARDWQTESIYWWTKINQSKCTLRTRSAQRIVFKSQLATMYGCFFRNVIPTILAKLGKGA
ncbi:hypothetical protein BGX29_004450 [Mortierella sp. GBA35]|nr:hypothetical protein BGX29_004450 [Mortierella sp. GBA35]